MWQICPAFLQKDATREAFGVKLRRMVAHGFGLGLAFASLLVGACALGGCGAADTGQSAPRSLGKACLPVDELVASFSGYSTSDVNIDEVSSDCGTGAVCLVSHFQGRVSCPFGQTEEEASMATSGCFLPHSDEKVTVAVAPQRIQRQPDRAVYCSCRCAGPDAGADYCECARGFECLELVSDLGVGASESRSYCVKKGAEDNTSDISLQTCSNTPSQCGDSRPFPP